MKKLMILFAMILAMLSCTDTTAPVEEPVVFVEPEGYYMFDIKTKFAKKMYITGSKNGLIAYLNNSIWAGVKYVGEDYSVWIKNAERVDINDSTRLLTFDLELRSPAMFTEGQLIIYRKISVEYIMNNDWVGQVGNPDAAEVQRLYQKYCDKIKMTRKLLPYVEKMAKESQPQFAIIIDILFDIIDTFLSEASSKEQKAEAVIVGSECYGQVAQWFSLLENGGFYIYDHDSGVIL